MKYIFKYPKEFTTLPEYSEHRGHIVEIIRHLRRDEYDWQGDAMFEIK